MTHSWDIVGYTYKADQFCPDHIVQEVIATHPSTFGVEDYVGVRLVSGESGLDALAERLNIDRSDEYSFDSDDFPKVIFRDQVTGVDNEDEDHNINADRCAECDELLENF